MTARKKTSSEPKADRVLTADMLWQSAFDDLWGKIAPFVMGREQRGDMPPCEYNEVFMKGGRSSGKSFTCSEWILMAMNNDPNKNAVVIRKVKSSIRNSCFEQVKKAIRKLGQEAVWQANETRLELRNKLTKQKILFVGLDDEEKVRSLTIERGYFSIVWFEEAKQFSSYEEIIQAKASILRGSEDGGVGNDIEYDGDAEFITFITYNPPKSMADWINEESSTPKKGRIVHSSTYLTMPRAWVGSNIIAEAERLRQHNPRMYKYIFLGEPVGVDSTYFHNIEFREITEAERASFPYFDMGIDWGEIDPNVFCKVYDDGEGTVYIFDEIYQDELPEDGTPKIHEFARRVKEMVAKCPDDPIYCDSAGYHAAEILKAPPYNLYVQLDMAEGIRVAKHGANSREAGYSYLQTRNKIVICSRTAPNIGREFLKFESETLPNGKPIDKPGKRNDHGPDCVRYALWKNIKYGNGY